MQIQRRIANIIALSATTISLGACANAGGLGSILGSVLGTGASGQQLTGTVQTVDSRNQQISVQQSNGQSIAVQYDQNTKVVYQNKLYAVTNLERGDQIDARIQTTQSNTYYTDSIAVTGSVSNGTSAGNGTTGESIQQLAGTVRSIDRNNGRFTVDASSSVTLTVTMPYRASAADNNKYTNMRVGDYVRFTGVYLNSNLVELRGFF